jgi:hypothetical protein
MCTEYDVSFCGFFSRAGTYIQQVCVYVCVLKKMFLQIGHMHLGHMYLGHMHLGHMHLGHMHLGHMHLGKQGDRYKKQPSSHPLSRA